MCDKQLMHRKEHISNIEFLLGSKSTFCAPEIEIPCGRLETSVYSKTPFGILLEGDVKQLFPDLPYLSSLKIHAGAVALQETVSRDDIDHSRLFNSKTTVALNELDRAPKPPDNFTVVNEDGEINENEIQRATNSILDEQCNLYTHYDSHSYNEQDSNISYEMVEFALNNTFKDDEGRLVMHLLWNSKVSHLLGKNFNLPRKILFSNLRKLQNKTDHLNLMKEAFLEQEKLGIIECIDNLNQFLEEHPKSSFLPSMGVFKLNRETTKCRIAFL